MRTLLLKDKNNIIVAKLTIEEVNSQFVNYITTYWIPNESREVGREVFEFETFSAAESKFYELALSFALNYSDLSASEDNFYK